MSIDEFLRLYPLRAQNITWFLGAGASAAAGVPTAYDMIWDFKRSIYCAAERVSVRSCADLGDQAVRSRIQSYFGIENGYPDENSAEEYAFYFERAYPAEADRRQYIDNMVKAATPSYGHLVLAALLKMNHSKAIWTTNFDRTVEDSAVSLLGSSSKLVTASLDSPVLATQAMNEGRWPLLVKLHGDFQSRRLKNARHELLAQDGELRRAFVDGCRRFGLAVAGYSGRDESIMDALEEAIDNGRGFPSGIFWFHRPDYPPLGRVSDFLCKAGAAGVEAHIIDVQTFDELMGDILLMIREVPTEVMDVLGRKAPRVTDAPIPDLKGRWPWIRLNAIPLLSWPSTCRRVVCGVGGAKEVRDAIAVSGANVVAGRRQVGVIAFGSDGEVRKAFEPLRITEFDLHSIETPRLRWDSAEMNLLYDAFCRALARERPVLIQRRRRGWVIQANPARATDPAYNKLKSATGGIHGKVPGTDLLWAEAVRIRLEFRLGRLWLLLAPTIWVDDPRSNNAENSATDYEENETRDLVVKEFVRERLARRYNKPSNEVIAAWADLINAGTAKSEIRSFGIGDGVDAVFAISSATAYTQRGDG